MTEPGFATTRRTRFTIPLEEIVALRADLGNGVVTPEEFARMCAERGRAAPTPEEFAQLRARLETLASRARGRLNQLSGRALPTSSSTGPSTAAAASRDTPMAPVAP